MTDEKLPNADDAQEEQGSVETPEENLEGSEPQVEQAEAEQPDNSKEEDKVVNEGDESEEDAEAAMMAMLEDLPEENSGTKPDDIDFGSNPDISNAQFQHLAEPASTGEARNIDMLMDVNLPVAIELGRTKMTISDILSLGPGSVVELNKLAGEPVDVLVNNKPVARGEVVVIDENFGVRVTQLLTPEERLRAVNDQS